jgi:gamma-F420-2:alpha-L-glutamate ligase
MILTVWGQASMDKDEISFSGIILYSRESQDLTDQDYGVLRLLAAAKAQQIAISVYTPDQFSVLAEQVSRRQILINGQWQPLPDFIIPRLGSQTCDHALAILRMMQQLGVYICNSADAILAVKDKFYMHQCLASHNLPTPRTLLASQATPMVVVEQCIGFPLVIKPVSGTQGCGVLLCESPASLKDIMDLTFTHSPQAQLILQSMVVDSYGQDIRVFLVDGQIIGCMRRSAVRGFKANVAIGAQVTFHTVDEKIRYLATRATELFGLQVAGVDLLFHESGYQICEINSAPGFQGLETVTGACIADKIIQSIPIKIVAQRMISQAMADQSIKLVPSMTN